MTTFKPIHELRGKTPLGGQHVASPGHTVESIVALIVRFHEDTHTGPWPFCELRPCNEVRGRERETST